jgi:electron transport complex protein RnfG
VAKTGGQGYADKIEILIGFDHALKTITGLFVLDQKETPGLGNKIIEPAWRGQFKDKSTQTPLSVVKTGAKAAHEINAITGATISSKSVTGIINSATGDLKKSLAGDKTNTNKG